MTSCLGVRGAASETDDDLQAAGRGGRKNWGRMRTLGPRTTGLRPGAKAPDKPPNPSSALDSRVMVALRTPCRRHSRIRRLVASLIGSWSSTARAFLNRDRSRSPARVLGHPIGHARG